MYLILVRQQNSNSDNCGVENKLKIYKTFLAKQGYSFLTEKTKFIKNVCLILIQ